MYTKGKYVVGEIALTAGSNLGAVCISEGFNHSDLRPVFVPNTIDSAGFFHVNNDLTVSVYGESVGLKVKSNQQRDAKLIARALALPMGHT